MDRKWSDLLVKVANHGLSRGTWSSYKTALKALGKCAQHTGQDIHFPLKQEQTLTFIAWMTDK